MKFLSQVVLFSYLNFKLQLGIDGVHHFCSLHCTSALITLPHKLHIHTYRQKMVIIN